MRQRPADVPETQRAMRRHIFLSAVLLGTSSASEAAFAQPRDLRWAPATDISLTVAGAAAWGVNEWGGPTLSRCRWCETDALDLAVRRSLVWKAPEGADRMSDFVAFAVAPVASIGLDALAAWHDRAAGHAWEDAVLIAEATVVAVDIDSLVKVVAVRERPSAYRRRVAAGALADPRRDDNLSFFSGHATETSALAAAAGTVATLHGYRWAPVVWGVGGSAAVFTGYLRVAADRHWFTDVVTGLAVGTGIGIAVPCMFHQPDAPDLEGMASSAQGGVRIRRGTVSNARVASLVFRW